MSNDDFYTEDDVLRIAATYLELWLDHAAAAGVKDWVRVGLFDARRKAYEPVCAAALASTVGRAVRLHGRGYSLLCDASNKVVVMQSRVVVEPLEAAALGVA